MVSLTCHRHRCLQLGWLLVVAFGRIQAQTSSNLQVLCNGDGPNAVRSALPFFDPPFPDTDIRQFCVQPGNGRTRCFYVMIPPGTAGAVPLLFDLHGIDSCPVFSVFYTGWFQIARDNKFVVVWPLGTTDTALASRTCFSFKGGLVIHNIQASDCCCAVGLDTNFTDPDLIMDSDFLRMAIEAVKSTIVSNWTSTGDEVAAVSIDPTKVFMAGHSNGCISALSMGVLHSDIVTGVACHAGKLITPFPDDYSPVPTFLVHGRLDVVLLYEEFSITSGKGYGSTPDIFQAYVISALLLRRDKPSLIANITHTHYCTEFQTRTGVLQIYWLSCCQTTKAWWSPGLVASTVPT
jgi:hypothetical protein